MGRISGGPMRRIALFVAAITAACLRSSLVLGDADDGNYAYDPTDMSGSQASTVADMEGSLEAPTNLWHACKFGAKKGGIFDLRGLSRNEKLLKAHLRWGTAMDIDTEDWIHQDVVQQNVTYYLNVCADVIEVPEVCQALQVTEPSPAYQVTANGQCDYLGTLKTFKWKPIDSAKPGKGMILHYENGGSCGGQGQTKSVKYVFTCSRYFDQDAGPMVVYQKDACHYDVVWPSKFGCPETSIMQQVGLQDDVGEASDGGKIFFVVCLVVGVCALAVYCVRKRSDAIGAYSSL